VERLQLEHNAKNRHMKSLVYNRQGHKGDVDKLLADQRKTRQALAALVAKESSLTALLQQLDQTRAAAQRQRQEAEAKLTQLRIALATQTEQRRALERERDRLTRDVATLQEQRTTIEREEGELRQALAAGEERVTEERRAFLLLGQELARREQELSQRDITRGKLREEQRMMEEKRRALKQGRGEIERRRRDILERLQQLHYEREALVRRIQERYDLNLEEMEAHPSPPSLGGEEVSQLEGQLQVHRQSLDTFGEVNLLAIDEYTTLKERYDFLTSQAQDLNRSIGALQRTISRINQLSRERFQHTFTAVNACFQELFARIFPGGKGAMVLTDEGDLLETGVDISVKFPGKKLQHIGLLSGGEKAMAALAFVISFLLYRPTPFIILDEVDAALDDTNIHLFVELIRDISAHSQVLIITHNKLSMEAAHHLYGVTMEKKGVSKVLSVTLT